MIPAPKDHKFPLLRLPQIFYGFSLQFQLHYKSRSKSISLAMALEIEGRHALLFDDDAGAAFVNSLAALVPWNGDESLLIDRYDVRHLLDRIPPRPKKHRFIEDTGGVSQSDLDRERFLDLPLIEDDNDEKETIEKSEATGSGSYQAVPFSYANDGSTDPDSSGPNRSAFHPPFPVPTSLHGSLPPTEKLHQIMARTALFVSEHGGQSEIVLRVKQGDNPTFGFLMPNNQLHPYFRFLVKHQLLKADSTQEEKKSDARDNAAVAPGGALSLLGSVYGTGEDDNNAQQQESEEGDTSKAIADGNSVLPQNSLKEESASSVGDKEPIKQAFVAPTKEKSFLSKRNHFVNSGTISKKGEATISQLDIVNRPSSQPGKIDVKPVIVEPPSFLKRTVDKIVEFILRNGKEFEAVLVEQDKMVGRFPFLLPSNQYNSYYLKVLQESVVSKTLAKNPSDGSKRKSQEASTSEFAAANQFEGWPLDPQRKEKFKMVIGGSKKESNDQPAKPIRQSGVTADEAAAIVLAATRGRSPFQNTLSAADSDSLRASSTKSLSLPHNGEAGDVTVATVIAKTAALAALGEADSSEASLTKELKLKAERLKRAKLFASMIKSSGHPATQLPLSSGTPSGCAELSTVASNHEEREGSCVPFDVDASAKERNYRKKQHSRSKDDNEEGDSDEEDKHSKKKHRRHHSHGYHHHRKHHDSEDDERREKKHHHHHHRHHKYRSDSEDEDRHAKRSKHRHRKHDLSEEEDRERSHKHRRKHRSPFEKSDEIEEGEVCEKSGSQSDVADNVKEADHAKPLDDVTEIPSDLRAKIRVLLLETI